MSKKRSGERKTAKPRDLSARKGRDPKGGMLGSALSNVVKSIGDGLSTAARKG